MTSNIYKYAVSGRTDAVTSVYWDSMALIGLNSSFSCNYTMYSTAQRQLNKHTRATRVQHAWDTRARVLNFTYVRARAHYAYVIPLLIFWASVIAKEAPFSSVYCYYNAMPAAAL